MGINSRLLESKMVLHGYNIKEFSKKLGVSRNTISNLLRGKYKPSYPLMLAIIQELKLTPQEAADIFFARNLAWDAR